MEKFQVNEENSTLSSFDDFIKDGAGGVCWFVGFFMDQEWETFHSWLGWKKCGGGKKPGKMFCIPISQLEFSSFPAPYPIFFTLPALPAGLW